MRGPGDHHGPDAAVRLLLEQTEANTSQNRTRSDGSWLKLKLKRRMLASTALHWQDGLSSSSVPHCPQSRHSNSISTYASPNRCTPGVTAIERNRDLDLQSKPRRSEARS